MSLIHWVSFLGTLVLFSLCLTALNSGAEELEWTSAYGEKEPVDIASSASGNYSAHLTRHYDDGLSRWVTTLFLFNATGHELYQHQLQNFSYSLDMTRDGQLVVVTVEGGDLYLFDHSGPLPIAMYNTNCSSATPIIISGESGQMAYSCGIKDFQVMDLSGNVLHHRPTQDVVESLAYSDDGAILVAVSLDGTLYYLDRNGNLLWDHPAEEFMRFVDLSAQGEYVVSHDGGKILFFNSTGHLIWNKPTTSHINALSISGTGDYLAYANDDVTTMYSRDSTQLWEFDSGMEPTSFELDHNGTNLMVAINQWIVVWGKESSNVLWDWDLGDGIWSHAAMSDDGQFIHVARWALGMKFWNRNQTVHIDAISPTTTSEGQLVELSGHAVDGMPLKGYEWSSDLDGILSQRASFNLSNLSVGLHTISFKVQDWDDIWSAPVQGQVTIHARPVAILGQNLSIRVDEGSTALVNGSGTTQNSISAYNWSSDLDGFLSNRSKAEVTILSPGQHTISLRVRDEFGAWSDPVHHSLYANFLPRVTLLEHSPDIPLVAQEVTFNAQSFDPDGEVMLYEWDLVGDGSALTREPNGTASFKYPAVGNQTMRLRVQDKEGAWSLPYEMTIYLNSQPSIMGLVTEPETVHAGQKVKFTLQTEDSDGQVALFQWRLYGDATVVLTDDKPSVEFVYPQAGNVTLRVAVQDDLRAWSESSEFQLTVLDAEGSGDGDDDQASETLLFGSVFLFMVALVLLVNMIRKPKP